MLKSRPLYVCFFIPNHIAQKTVGFSCTRTQIVKHEGEHGDHQPGKTCEYCSCIKYSRPLSPIHVGKYLVMRSAY